MGQAADYDVSSYANTANNGGTKSTANKVSLNFSDCDGAQMPMIAVLFVLVSLGWDRVSNWFGPGPARIWLWLWPLQHGYTGSFYTHSHLFSLCWWLLCGFSGFHHAYQLAYWNATATCMCFLASSKLSGGTVKLKATSLSECLQMTLLSLQVL